MQKQWCLSAVSNLDTLAELLSWTIIWSWCLKQTSKGSLYCLSCYATQSLLFFLRTIGDEQPAFPDQ